MCVWAVFGCCAVYIIFSCIFCSLYIFFNDFLPSPSSSSPCFLSDCFGKVLKATPYYNSTCEELGWLVRCGLVCGLNATSPLFGWLTGRVCAGSRRAAHTEHNCAAAEANEKRLAILKLRTFQV